MKNIAIIRIPLIAIGLALSIGAVGGCASCPAAPNAKRTTLDRSKFQIGVYCFGYDFLRDEQHVAELKTANINFVFGLPYEFGTEYLDLFSKYGIGCVASDIIPGWWGGDGKNAGKMREQRPRKDYVAELAKKRDFINHPAVWMINLCDEPSAKDFEYLGEICQLIKETCPEKLPYLNLYPNYAVGTDNTGKQVIDQLGTPTYEEHLAVYDKLVPLDYLSYDHYMYYDDPKLTEKWTHKMFLNYEQVAKVCRASGRDFWYIPQVNTRPKQKLLMVPAKLRYQAYSAMAYGAVSIAWACWTPGWWDNNVYDREGVRNDDIYNWLKEVNGEIKSIEPVFMRFRNVDTRRIGFENCEKSYSDGVFRSLRALDGSKLVIGSMVPRVVGDSAHAAFVFAAEDPNNLIKNNSRVLSFAAYGKIRAYSPRGEEKLVRNEKGDWTLTFRDNDFVMLVAE